MFSTRTKYDVIIVLINLTKLRNFNNNVTVLLLISFSPSATVLIPRLYVQCMLTIKRICNKYSKGKIKFSERNDRPKYEIGKVLGYWIRTLGM